MNDTFDFHKGVVVEGTLQATCRDRRLVASSAGFYLEEEPGEGTAILLHSYGRTEMGKMTLADRVDFQSEDVIGPGCAAPAGIAPHTNHTFRLLVARTCSSCMWTTCWCRRSTPATHRARIGLTPQRLGFIAQNGQAVFENVRAWSMNLDEPD